MGAVAADLVRGHEGSRDDAEDAEREERRGECDLLDGRAARAPDRAADQVVVVGDGEGVVHVRHAGGSRGRRWGTRLARPAAPRGGCGSGSGSSWKNREKRGRGGGRSLRGAQRRRGRVRCEGADARSLAAAVAGSRLRILTVFFLQIFSTDKLI